MASHIALLEAGVAFEVERVDFSEHALGADGGRFRDINPKGFVPALEIGPGNILTENIAVLQFIADLNPRSGLAPPPQSMQRYRLQEWLGFINSDFHRSFTILFKASTPNPTTEMFRRRIAAYLDYLAEVLTAQRFLMGNTFTVADCYLFTVLSWADSVRIDLSKWPSIVTYRADILGRDSVREVLEWESHER
jgi:glutathione S-transferase